MFALRAGMGDGRNSIFTRSRFVLVWNTSLLPISLRSLRFELSVDHILDPSPCT